MTDREHPSELGDENLDSRIDELLRRVAHVPAAQIQDAETQDAPPPLQPVRTVARSVPTAGSIVDNRYRVEGTLGEGAMGVVLAAHNLRTGREVALKYMLGDERASYAQRAARVERFVREAQAVGRVRDARVVDIYDVGGDLDAPYLVMERLYGQSLRARMDQGVLPEDELVPIALDAARGVLAAHRQGVIHRDLKPDNLFLARDEQQKTSVKVLDFGVSRILDDTALLATITRSGTIVGTPAYMPLEQLRGVHEVDARVDVYALGAIMYEALSGKLPFDGRTLHDLVLLMANDKATPLAEVAPQVAPWLCSVVMKCLSRAPDHRFADMSALIEALEAREPVVVVSLVPQPPPPQVARKRIWPLLLFLFLFVAIAFGLFMVARTPEPPPALGAEPEKVALPPPTVVAPSPQPQVVPQAPPPSEPPAATAPTEKNQQSRPPKPASPARPRNPAARARDIRPEDF